MQARNGPEATRARMRLREPSPAMESYLALCSDYLRRQILVYRNWPQRAWDATGYRRNKVFRDRNA